MTMSSSEAISKPTLSGIITTDKNERVIPATRRADGTLRKERKVRQGFVPQEDVARYRNPWAEETAPPPPPPKPELPKKKAQKKNEKRKLKRKEREKEGSLESIDNEIQQAAEEDTLGQLQSKISEMSISKGHESPAVSITIEQLENTTKRIKVLEKKIRQIERIKDKQTCGEPLKLEEEEKLNKLEQIQEELKRLKQGDEE